MRTLTNQEKRTIRIGAGLVAVYLLIFGGMQGWNYLDKKRSEYVKLVKEAQGLKEEATRYKDKALVLQKLMEGFHLDPAKLSRASVLAQASSAIQKAAMSGGIQIGPVRESPARPSNKELGSMQLEAMGQVPALMKFLHQTESLGYPLIIESLQIGSDPTKPGPMVKLTLTILILDFEPWKDGTHV